MDAHRILGEQGVRAKNGKDKIDSVAATLILEGYLDWKRLQASDRKGRKNPMKQEERSVQFHIQCAPGTWAGTAFCRATQAG